MMPFIGVRISWLIVARKLLLVAVAACAKSRASRNSSA
jgi:hypothetical protein